MPAPSSEFCPRRSQSERELEGARESDTRLKAKVLGSSVGLMEFPAILPGVGLTFVGRADGLVEFPPQATLVAEKATSTKRFRKLMVCLLQGCAPKWSETKLTTNERLIGIIPQNMLV